LSAEASFFEFGSTSRGGDDELGSAGEQPESTQKHAWRIAQNANLFGNEKTLRRCETDAGF
jgi:hypothetical protein